MNFVRPLYCAADDVFVRFSEATGFVPQVGLAVRFTPETTRRGLKALRLRLA